MLETYLQFLTRKANEKGLTSAPTKVLLALIEERKTKKEVIDDLHISERTFRSHMNTVYSCFGIEGKGTGKLEKLRVTLDKEYRQSNSLASANTKTSEDNRDYLVQQLSLHSAEVTQPQEPAQEETPSKNSDFVGREEAIAELPPENEPDKLVKKARSHSAAVPQPQEPAQEETPSKNSDFVGREEAVNDLDNLVNEGAKVILIQAEGGIGKTTLAQKWFEHQGLEPLLLRVGMTPQNIQPAEDWVRHKLLNDFQENPERNFLTMLEQLRVKLQTQRIGVLIDNLEPALINGEFIESHQSYYVELLTVLAHPTVQSITLVTSRESLHEPGIMGLQTFQTYLLEGLKKKAWEKYFDSQNISINLNTLSEMYRAYGGNALAMQLLSSDIRKKTQGNLEVYWQHNRDDLLRLRSLKSLVKRQFNKLREDNRHAYNLLCRLGFYPERDVPFVPNVWLRCLLWDVPEKNRQQVIDDLCDRSLLKVSDQGYYLHPVIRAEAVYRLNFTPEGNREYLIFIKEQIDLLIAQDREIQNALSWISQKFNLVSKFYKKAAFRAFYLGCVLQFIFEFVPSIMDNQYKNIEIAYLLEKDFLTLCGKGTYEQACKAAQEAFYRESKELVNIVKNIIKLNKIRKIERSFEDIYKEAVEVYFRKGYEQNIEPFPKLDFMKIEIIAKLKFELIFTLELEDEEIKNLNKSGEFEQFRNDFIQATIKGYRKGHIEAKKHKPTIEQYKAGLLSQSKIIRLILETLSLNSDKINKKESIKK